MELGRENSSAGFPGKAFWILFFTEDFVLGKVGCDELCERMGRGYLRWLVLTWCWVAVIAQEEEEEKTEDLAGEKARLS